MLYNNNYSVLRLTKIHFSKSFCASNFLVKSVAIHPSHIGEANQKKIICHIPHNKGPLISLNIDLKHQPYIWRRCSENTY